MKRIADLLSTSVSAGLWGTVRAWSGCVDELIDTRREARGDLLGSLSRQIAPGYRGVEDLLLLGDHAGP